MPFPPPLNIQSAPDGHTPPLFEGAEFAPVSHEPITENDDGLQECCTCGNRRSRSESIELDGENHCTECVHTCEHCDAMTVDGDEIQSAHTGRRYDTAMLCSECRFECADCDEQCASDTEHHSNSNGDRICHSCAANYGTCDDCGGITHNDNLNYDDTATASRPRFDDDDDKYYCDSCFTSHCRDDDPPIRQYGYTPKTEYHHHRDEKTGRNALYLGVEIETQPKRDNRNLDDDVTECGLADSALFYCKEDGSISEGFEIVSHPATLAYWQEYEWGFTKELRGWGYQSYNDASCGMHVHVSRRCLSTYSIYKLLRFFKLNEALVYQLSRRQSRSQLDQYANLGENWTRRGTNQLSNKAKRGNNQRYEAINLQNSHTVEFRVFQGTLVPESIHRNIALCAALAHFVNRCGARQMRARQFIAWLRHEGWRFIGRKDAMNLDKWICTVSDDTSKDD